MPHPSLLIIRQEHRALSSMLRSILLLLADHRRRGSLPDFAALRAMLFYVDEFPEKLHHPKESLLLFPKLRGHAVRTDALLDRLDRDHASGESLIQGLEHALLGFEMMAETGAQESRRAEFETAMHLYARFYLEHMRVEETEVLPLAEAVLGPDDWAELDTAFQTHRDPLAGFEATEAYQPLFRKIVCALPGAGGVGSALEALAGAGPAKYRAPA
ncbi:MAG: hemerythrin domain-containing protein [Burkholderiaceae bacterium]